MNFWFMIIITIIYWWWLWFVRIFIFIVNFIYSSIRTFICIMSFLAFITIILFFILFISLNFFMIVFCLLCSFFFYEIFLNYKEYILSLVIFKNFFDYFYNNFFFKILFFEEFGSLIFSQPYWKQNVFIFFVWVLIVLWTLFWTFISLNMFKSHSITCVVIWPYVKWILGIL